VGNLYARETLAISLILAAVCGCHFRDRDSTDAGPRPDRHEPDSEPPPPLLLEPTRGTHLTRVTAYGSFSGAWEIELTGASGTHILSGERMESDASDSLSFHMPLEVAGDVTVRSRADDDAWREHGVFTLESLALGPVPATEVGATIALATDRTAIVGTERGLPFIAELAPGEVRRWPERASPPPDDAGVPDDGGATLDDGGVADAATAPDAGIDAGTAIADGGMADAGAAPPGEMPVSIESAALYAGSDGALGAIAALHPDGALRRFAAQPDGTLAITDPDLVVECVLGAGVDASGVYVWISTGTSVRRRRPDDAWATDVGPIPRPSSRARCPTLAGDGSMIVAWSTIGGGPFDDTATIWTSQLEPGALAFTPPQERGGPHDDIISFTHLQGTAEGHHILSYCYTDSGIGGDGTDCRGPRLLRIPAGSEELDVGPPIDGKVRAYVTASGVLWARNLITITTLRVPDTSDDRGFLDSVTGPIAISDASTFHAPITSLTETWILILPAIN
jgi:hypothetical protein